MMRKETGVLSDMPIKWARRIFLAVVIAITVVFVYYIFSQVAKYLSTGGKPDSAYDYYVLEGEFLKRYVHDEEEGGFYYWVDKKGVVRDDRKYSLFQSNVILWYGGLQSQHPDKENIKMIVSASDYLVDYLYKGSGEWYEYDTRNHRGALDFFWNPRNESYISFALLQAYRLTEDERYLIAAEETNAAQRNNWPDGHIYSMVDRSQEIGQRFPEHMGQLEEYRITGNEDAIEFARLFDDAYSGKFGKEILNNNVDTFFYHGMAVVDQLLYGYLDNNGKAFSEGSNGRNAYWSMRHDDARSFNPEVPGESSDHGRDYYDKRLAMDLIEWSMRGVGVYQADAVDTWDEVLRFWDSEFPYGFEINTLDNRKTCFSIGVSQYLMDLKGPTVVSFIDNPKAFFNHQAVVTFHDDNYTWNDIEMRGIGVEGAELKWDIPLGMVYGDAKVAKGSCENCISYEINYVSLLPLKAKFGTKDLFGNVEMNQVNNVYYPFATISGLNKKSVYYYGFVTIAILIILFIIYAVVFLIVYKNRELVKITLGDVLKRNPKDKNIDGSVSVNNKKKA